VEKAITGLQAEIIVIDNASSDGSMEYLLSRFPRVNFIDNPSNAGFAKANNQGLVHAKGRYILFLNPDTIVSENALGNCLNFLEGHPEAGACGVRMLDGSGRFLPESKRGFPSIPVSLFKISGLTKLFPRSRLFASYYAGHLDEKQDNEIDVLSGAFFMVKKEVLRKTGGFDEQFFMYGEDIDLSYRIQLAGYKNFYLYRYPIIHFKGESTSKGSLDYVKLFHKAMSIFVKKHYTGGPSIKGLIIQASIWSKAGLKAFSNMMYRRPAVPTAKIRVTVIIGSSEEVSRVKSILQRHPDYHAELKPLMPGPEVKKTALELSPDEIIFCEGTLSFAHIMEAFEYFPENINFRIHSAGSSSIIGSNSKNSIGNVLAL
jgi:GT2 family glycosyltransferase